MCVYIWSFLSSFLFTGAPFGARRWVIYCSPEREKMARRPTCRLGSNHVFAVFTKVMNDSPRQGEGTRSDA